MVLEAILIKISLSLFISRNEILSISSLALSRDSSYKYATQQCHLAIDFRFSIQCAMIGE